MSNKLSFLTNLQVGDRITCSNGRTHIVSTFDLWNGHYNPDHTLVSVGNAEGGVFILETGEYRDSSGSIKGVAVSVSSARRRKRSAATTTAFDPIPGVTLGLQNTLRSLEAALQAARAARESAMLAPLSEKQRLNTIVTDIEAVHTSVSSCLAARQQAGKGTP